jgi:hypothetical protein
VPVYANYFERNSISTDCLYLDEPITNEFLVDIKKHTIKFVHCSGAAPNNVFDTAKLFPYVQRVALVASADSNEHMLAALAENFPNLNEITISQSKALSNSALQNLSRFKKLKYLHFKCELADPTLFAKCAPDSLSDLTVESSDSGDWAYPQLHHLRSLRIWQGRIDAQILKSFSHSYPFVKVLELDGDVNNDVYTEIAKFKHLERLSMRKTIVGRSNYKMLQEAGIKEIFCRHE